MQLRKRFDTTAYEDVFGKIFEKEVTQKLKSEVKENCANIKESIIGIPIKSIAADNSN